MSLTIEDNLSNIAPAHYAQSAALAAAVAAEMVARLEWVSLQPAHILDIGCGTGLGTRLLQEKYPLAHISAVDIAHPMLQFAKPQAPNAFYVCAEASALPYADHSMDLVFANLVLPWCADMGKTLREWRRVLRPEGLLMFTAFGPDTLQDWRADLADFTLPNFVDMHEIGDILTRTRFSDPVMDVEQFSLRYRHSADFFRELQGSGILIAGDYVVTESKPAAHFIAEYEIIYGHAWGPAETVDQVANEFGEVSIPLASLRRQFK